MPHVILIRHGQSEGNRDRVFTPTPDVPITEAGREQVRAAAAWVAARHRPARVVSSPFRRARESADIVAWHLGVGVVVEDDLREQAYGTLAGRPYAALRELGDYDPERYWLWRPPGGETLVEVAARAGAALDRIVRAAPGDEVVVVSHGGVMMALWQHVTGSWRQGRVARNAGIVLVEHAGGRWLGAAAVDEA